MPVSALGGVRQRMLVAATMWSRNAFTSVITVLTATWPQPQRLYPQSTTLIVNCLPVVWAGNAFTSVITVSTATCGAATALLSTYVWSIQEFKSRDYCAHRHPAATTVLVSTYGVIR